MSEKDEFEARQKKLEKVANPIIGRQRKTSSQRGQMDQCESSRKRFFQLELKDRRRYGILTRPPLKGRDDDPSVPTYRRFRVFNIIKAKASGYGGPIWQDSRGDSG